MDFMKAAKTAAGLIPKNKKERTAVQTAMQAAGIIVKTPLLLGAVLGTAVFAADQLFKSSIEKQPDEIFPHDAAEKGIGAEVELQKMHNRGIAMNRLEETPEKAEKLALCGAAAVGVDLLTRDPKDGPGIVSGCVALGGAVSNLYDRKTRGYVVDYIHLKKGPLSKIVFNLGDAAIAAGLLTGSLSRFIVNRSSAEKRNPEYRK